MTDSQAPRGCGDLDRWLAWQESAHPKSWDLGLSRIGAVWQALGAPRIAGTIISIAGTNGKGSCAAWCEAICKSHNVSCASFTSPHLLDYRERIRFNGEMVGKAALCEAFDAIDAARGEISLTYFEWSALAAFYLTSKAQPDAAILEAGLGGRLDAVNLVDADAVIFTKIGLDHQDWLGDTADKIALEKAGILRQGQTAAFADSTPPQVLLNAAKTAGAALLRLGHEIDCQPAGQGIVLQLLRAQYSLPLPANLAGSHQFGHLAAAAAVLDKAFTLTETGLAKACQTAHNPARLAVMPAEAGAPRVIVDVAHNPDSAAVLAGFLRAQRQGDARFHIVCGMLKDKDQAASLAQLADIPAHWYFASLGGARGADAAMLMENAARAGIAPENCSAFESVKDAVTAAKTAAGQTGDTAVIMGSFVTVTEFLTLGSQA